MGRGTFEEMAEARATSDSPMARLINALPAEAPWMHGLPQPQRFELISSTVYTDGSTVQVLRPAGHDR